MSQSDQSELVPRDNDSPVPSANGNVKDVNSSEPIISTSCNKSTPARLRILVEAYHKSGRLLDGCDLSMANS
jgi:hypothetical protein